MANEERVEEVTISKEGINLKSVTLNTFVTLVVALGVAGIGALTWKHGEETKASTEAFIAALKDQTKALQEGTTAQREQTCIMKFDQAQRQGNGDFCKQVSGSR